MTGSHPFFLLFISSSEAIQKPLDFVLQIKSSAFKVSAIIK